MKSIFIAFFLSLSTVVADGSDTTSNKVFNIKSFGAIGDGVATVDRWLFDACFENYFWNYDNNGLKLLELRFYAP